jgi:hypothetical protein
MRRETAQLIDAMASRSFVSSDEKFTWNFHTHTNTHGDTQKTQNGTAKKNNEKFPPIKYKITVFKNGEFRKKINGLTS